MPNKPILFRPPERRQYRWGPVTRQRDRTVSLNTAEGAAVSILNCWLKDADTEFPVIEGRPGFVIAHQSMGATAAVQWVGQLSKADGTEVSAVIAAGEIWTYTWGTDTLTKVVTTANLTTASVTLSASARVFACEFANTLVFNDGTNRPFTWDGTSGAGGVTSLTNAPSVAYGNPWVYYAKLFFIKNAERNTIVWSEEGVPNTGYEAGGYSNAWTLRQTETGSFFAAAGTDFGLYVFRDNSIVRIQGEVTPNFSTTGNDDFITKVGCKSPNGVLNMGTSLIFATGDRRIMVLAGGAQPVEVSHGARQRLAALNAAQFAKVFVEFVDFHEQGERVVVAIPETGSDDCNAYIVINPATGLVEGTWTGWKSTAFGRWKNASGEWRLVHGGGDAATTVDDGLVYIHDVPNGGTWSDEFLAGTSPIGHVVETSFIGPDADQEKTFLGGTLVVQSQTGVSGVTVTVKTSRGDTVLTTPLTSDAQAGAQWGTGVWGVDVWGDESALGEYRLTFATRGVTGRHARYNVSHAQGVERFGLSEATATAVVTDRRPTTK